MLVRGSDPNCWSEFVLGNRLTLFPPRQITIFASRSRQATQNSKTTYFMHFGALASVHFINLPQSARRERKGPPSLLVTKLGGPKAGWVGGSPAEFRGQRVGPGHLAATVSAAKRPKKRRARGRPNAHKSACANAALAHAGGTQDLPCPFVGVRSADLPSITGRSLG